jgi:hypothetical protein
MAKQCARNAPAAEQNQRNGGELPQQLRCRHRNSGPIGKSGNPFVEQGGLQLSAEELGVVGVKRGIHVALYCGKIHTVVFNAGMVPHHDKSQD